MQEGGVDMSWQSFKPVSNLIDVPFELVVVVCVQAHETCLAILRKARIVRVGVDDSPKLAQSTGSKPPATWTRRGKSTRRQVIAYARRFPSYARPSRKAALRTSVKGELFPPHTLFNRRLVRQDHRLRLAAKDVGNPGFARRRVACAPVVGK